MIWIPRVLAPAIRDAASSRPALLVTGARQTGKTSLLRRAMPEHKYVTLDRTMVARAAQEAPATFLENLGTPVIIDEVQYAPALFPELKIAIDERRNACGRWLLTGSQRFDLMQHISESLAGRIRILELFTLSAAELRGCGELARERVDEAVWRGGYPELWTTPIDPREYFEDYVQTYLERDLRNFLNVGSLSDFARFIKSVAIRAGQLLNYSDLARDVGVTVNTIKAWLTALEAGGIVYLLPAFGRNLGRRLVKAPMVYFADNGILCHLLGARGDPSWRMHPHSGQIWENFVFTELLKSGARPGGSLFYYRDTNGVEIDFVIDQGGTFTLVEAKASEVVHRRKLNFAKVAPVFQKLPGARVNCRVACLVPESAPISLGSYELFNPIHCAFATHDLGSEM